MPCACQVPVPTYPETADWGPIMWLILHGLAEKAGQSSIQADELRQWVKFIKLTGDVLPCDHCRAHFKTYSAKHPLTQITTIPFTQVKQFLQTWFWELHNEINISRGLPVFPFANLQSTYSSVNLTDQLHQLTPVIRKAILLSGVPMLSWIAWVNSFKMLRSVLGI